LAVATLVALATFYILPVQTPAVAGNSQSRYSIITEDDVPGEVVQPPRKKLKKKTAPETPEAQKKQLSGSNYSSRSQLEAKKKLLDASVTEAESKPEQAVAEAGSPIPAVKKKRKSNEIFDLFGKPTSRPKKQEAGKISPIPPAEIAAKKPVRKAAKTVRIRPSEESAKQQLARAAERKAQQLALAKEKKRLAVEATRLEEAKKAQENAFAEEKKRLAAESARLAAEAKRTLEAILVREKQRLAAEAAQRIAELQKAQQAALALEKQRLAEEAARLAEVAKQAGEAAVAQEKQRLGAEALRWTEEAKKA